MKEKVQEFEVSIKFSLDSNMTIEAESEREALQIARKHYLEIIRDHLRDKSNLNITIKSSHTITEEEREKLEQEKIIEPRKLTARQQARLEKEQRQREFVQQLNAGTKQKRRRSHETV